MTSVNIEVEGIGTVLFERSKKAGRLNISLRPFKGVRVAVPYSISFERAETFVRSKIDWIKENLPKIKQMEHERKNSSKKPVTINRMLARVALLFRLETLAGKYGFTYNKVFIRNQKTRWGSCSSKNNINLNIKLVKLPKELIDYVILHELVHTRIKNHSKNFWTTLTKIIGNAKTLNSELKKYKIEIA